MSLSIVSWNSFLLGDIVSYPQKASFHYCNPLIPLNQMNFSHFHSVLFSLSVLSLVFVTLKSSSHFLLMNDGNSTLEHSQMLTVITPTEFPCGLERNPFSRSMVWVVSSSLKVVKFSGVIFDGGSTKYYTWGYDKYHGDIRLLWS